MPKTRDALRDPDTKREINRDLFDRIARRYDLITRILSLGRDSSWKRSLVAQLPEEAPEVCLDLATGSGDIAALLAERYQSATIRALDLSSEPNLTFENIVESRTIRRGTDSSQPRCFRIRMTQ